MLQTSKLTSVKLRREVKSNFDSEVQAKWGLNRKAGGLAGYRQGDQKEVRGVGESQKSKFWG